MANPRTRKPAAKAPETAIDFIKQLKKEGKIVEQITLSRLWDRESGYANYEMEVTAKLSKNGEVIYFHEQGFYLAPNDSFVHADMQDLEEDQVVTVTVTAQDPLELSTDEIKAHQKAGTKGFDTWQDAFDEGHVRLAVLEVHEA